MSNYEKTAKEMVKALSRMSEHVVACQKEVRMYRTKGLQEMVANLYTHVFLYLEDTMQWYLKKPRQRFLDAFDDSFFDSFEETIVNIERISRGILREVYLSSKAEIREIKSTADALRADMRVVLLEIKERKQEDKRHLEEQRRRETEQHEREERLRAVHGQDLQESLKALLFKHLRDGLIYVATPRPLSSGKAIDEGLRGLSKKLFPMLTSVGPGIQGPAFVKSTEVVYVQEISYQRDDILLNSMRLENMFDTSRVPAQCDASTLLTIDTSASSYLMEWTIARGSSLLSIAARKPSSLELAPMTVLVSMCINFAVKSSLPVISYFCEISRDELRADHTREPQELIGLTYALIRQLAEKLPPQFDSAYDFSDGRLSMLDGALQSWDTAIGMLKDLIELAPTPLFCIIDGFQVLDDNSTERLLVKFVKVLREILQRSSKIVKVFFTTTGRSRCLLGLLSQAELILADQDGAKKSPARRARNQRFSMG